MASVEEVEGEEIDAGQGDERNGRDDGWNSSSD